MLADGDAAHNSPGLTVHDTCTLHFHDALCVCSVGVEITPHKQDHAYRVVDDLSFPLFHPSWGVRPPTSAAAALGPCLIANQ